MQQDYGRRRDSSVPAFPAGDVLRSEGVVRVGGGAPADVNDDGRRDQRLRGQPIRAGAIRVESRRRRQMRAAVLAHRQAAQVVPLLPDGGNRLKLDFRVAGPTGDVGMYRMGQIHNPAVGDGFEGVGGRHLCFRSEDRRLFNWECGSQRAGRRCQSPGVSYGCYRGSQPDGRDSDDRRIIILRHFADDRIAGVSGDNKPGADALVAVAVEGTVEAGHRDARSLPQNYTGLLPGAHPCCGSARAVRWRWYRAGTQRVPARRDTGGLRWDAPDGAAAVRRPGAAWQRRM